VELVFIACLMVDMALVDKFIAFARVPNELT
jgi:hypothetical protein